jgi:hypothetical protein
MIITYFSIGQMCHIPLAWIELGMFPIEAYAYVATMVSTLCFRMLCYLLTLFIYFSFIVPYTCGDLVFIATNI